MGVPGVDRVMQMNRETQAMNRAMQGVMWAGLSTLMVAGLAGCNNQASAEGPSYAKVISATPIKKTSNHPTQECHDEAVTVQKPVKDEHQILGTAIGAVVGGVAGHQVGGGDGKKIATVVGAAAGAYAGHEIQKNQQEKDTQTVTKQVCKTVDHRTTKIVGYTVKYEYNGTLHTTRMDHDPGAQVQVQEGVSVLPTAK